MNRSLMKRKFVVLRKELFLMLFLMGTVCFNAIGQTAGDTVENNLNNAVEQSDQESEKLSRKERKALKKAEKQDKKAAKKAKKQDVKTEPVKAPANGSTPAQNIAPPATGDRTSEYLADFKSLDISYIGSTQNCVGYNVYALKYKKTWFLATNVNESPALSVFIEKAPRSEEAFPAASPFLVEGLKGLIVNDYLKKKNRRKKVKDLQLYGFYKMKRPGKTAAKGLLLIEFPKELNKEPEFFVFKFFYNLFNKKKEEMQPDPNIQQQFEEKLKEPMKKAEEEITGAMGGM